MFGRAVALLLSITLSLRMRGFNRTKEALKRRLSLRSRSGPIDGGATEFVQKACRMVRAAAHYGIIRPTCLAESLALWYLLKVQNIPVQLRIGVRNLAGRFEAHAWVEYEGEALNQPDEVHQHYAAFDSGFTDLPEQKV